MTSCTTTSSEPLNTASGGKRSGSTSTTCSRSMGMRSVLWRFDQVFGLRRSCSEEWSVWGGCGVLDWTLGLPCSPLSRLISSRRRWFSAWAARRSAITSSSTLSSRLTSSRVCSSTMLCRSRSSSIVPLAPVARGGVYGEPLCQISSVVATRQGMGFQPPIFEVIQFDVSLGVFRDTVKYVEEGKYPKATRHFIPVLCNQCEEAPCLKACPTGAIIRIENGEIVINKGDCNVNRFCMAACPYGAIYIDPEEHVAQKCTFCEHRTAQGMQPACVDACPTRCRIFGDLADPS